MHKVARPQAAGRKFGLGADYKLINKRPPAGPWAYFSINFPPTTIQRLRKAVLSAAKISGTLAGNKIPAQRPNDTRRALFLLI